MPWVLQNCTWTLRLLNFQSLNVKRISTWWSSIYFKPVWSITTTHTFLVPLDLKRDRWQTFCLSSKHASTIELHSEFLDAVQSSVVEQFGYHRTLYRGGSVYCTNLFSAIYKSVHPIPVRNRPKLYKTIMSRFYAKSAYRASVFVGRNDNQ